MVTLTEDASFSLILATAYNFSALRKMENLERSALEFFNT